MPTVAPVLRAARVNLRRGPSSAWLPVAVAWLLHLGLYAGYGPHRDELYVLAAGQRLALGYVDLPPLVPWIATFASRFGEPLLVLRLLAATAGAATTLIAVKIAEVAWERPVAARTVAWAVTLAPGLLAAGGIYQSTVIDITASALVCLNLVRAIDSPRMRDWAWLGLSISFAVWIKYTAIAFAGGLAIGAAVARPSLLRHRGPWLVALIVAASVIPQAVWQVANGFPTLAFVRASTADDHVGSSLVDAVLQVALMLGPFAGAAWLVGFRFDRAPGGTRAVILGCAVFVAGVLAVGGRPYYLATTYPALIALGAPRLFQSPRIGLALLTAGMIWALAVLSIAVPIVPAAQMAANKIWEVRGDYADMVGWDELVGEVVGVARSAGIDTIVTENVGEAGALLAAGLDEMNVFSPHLALYYQGPPTEGIDRLVVVGWSASALAPFFAHVDPQGVIANTLHVPNDEVGVPVYVCSGRRMSWSEIWAQIRDFTG